MRLLHTTLYELELFEPNKAPAYAILSHRWLKKEDNEEEVSYRDIVDHRSPEILSAPSKLKGMFKIFWACKTAKKDDYEYIWIDSCCIDRDSSADLQESINSMWDYYARANVCYVYLQDVVRPDEEVGPEFHGSEWFNRGWTLQELLAPYFVHFYNRTWDQIGTKLARQGEIATATGIDLEVLNRTEAIEDIPVARRLSWAAHRIVTRAEDEAYSLLGLFQVNIPLIYGEGRQRAFTRLQEAIYSASNDQSIFLFRYTAFKEMQPLLADSVRRFCDRQDCTSCPTSVYCFPVVQYTSYSKIMPTVNWAFQGPEQILTSVKPSRSEMSTELFLLKFEEVKDEIIFLDKQDLDMAEKRRIMAGKGHISHIVVLSHTLSDYKKGALCLPVNWNPQATSAFGCVTAFRDTLLPFILPDLGSLASVPQKQQLVICSGQRDAETLAATNFTFIVDSGDLDVGFEIATDPSSRWSISYTQTTRRDAYTVSSDPHPEPCPPDITCRVQMGSNPKWNVVIQLVSLEGNWVFSKCSVSQGRQRSVLFSTTLDSFSVSPPGEKKLSGQLRHLGDTRANNQSRNERYLLVIRHFSPDQQRPSPVAQP